MHVKRRMGNPPVSLEGLIQHLHKHSRCL